MIDLHSAAQRVLNISTELLRLYEWRFELFAADNGLNAREPRAMTPDEFAQFYKKRHELDAKIFQHGDERDAAMSALRPALADLRSALQQPQPQPDPCGYFCNATWGRLGMTPEGNLPPCTHPKVTHYSIDGENTGCVECENMVPDPDSSQRPMTIEPCETCRGIGRVNRPCPDCQPDARTVPPEPMTMERAFTDYHAALIESAVAELQDMERATGRNMLPLTTSLSMMAKSIREPRAYPPALAQPDERPTYCARCGALSDFCETLSELDGRKCCAECRHEVASSSAVAPNKEKE